MPRSSLHWEIARETDEVVSSEIPEVIDSNSRNPMLIEQNLVPTSLRLTPSGTNSQKTLIATG